MFAFILAFRAICRLTIDDFSVYTVVDRTNSVATQAAALDWDKRAPHVSAEMDRNRFRIQFQSPALLKYLNDFARNAVIDKFVADNVQIFLRDSN